jgi:hypothetical protein
LKPATGRRGQRDRNQGARGHEQRGATDAAAGCGPNDHEYREQGGQRHKDRDHVREERMSWQPTDGIKHRDFPNNLDIHYLPPFAF